MNSDPYLITNDNIEEAPTIFRKKVRHLGPGFILSASIVGSGELIATTTLGAKAGFVTFWVILVSCLVKVAIQLEFGKHAIHSGESVMVAFNKLPGRRWGKAHWTIWTWMGLMLLKLVQVGGIVGGVALVLQIAFPQASLALLAFGVALLVALMVFRGYYRFIESTSLVLMGLFTLFTILCMIFLQYTPYAVTWGEIGEGLLFQLPATAVAVAIGAFGITGVGGDEIMYYNYWCIEKGYAAKTGLRNDSPEWLVRAKSWINIMYWDALLAMVGYTIVTALFYLLGAAILHRIGQVPEGYETIEILSNIFTESLGNWAKPVFLAGSFVVLFSTLFAALASWIRVYTDAFGQVGWIDFNNLRQRKKVLAWLAFLFPVGWAISFLAIKMPVFMVLSGGIIGSIILFLVIYVAIYFRYFRLPDALKPSILYDVALLVSVFSIAIVAGYGIIKLL